MAPKIVYLNQYLRLTMPTSDHNHRIYLAETIIPMEPLGLQLKNGGLCVDGAGRVADVGAASQIRQKYPKASVVDLGQRVLLPGLINCHTHSAMSLMRGLCNDRSLSEWLNIIWPIEQQVLNEEFVTCGTELAVCEMLSHGTTTFNDMYLFPESTAAVVDRYGMRAVIGLPVVNFATPYATDVSHYLQRAERVLADWHDHPRLSCTLSPHAPYTVDDQAFTALLDWQRGQTESLLIQIHLHESAREIEDSLREFGVRPIDRLENLGLFEHAVLAVHMCHLNAHDIELCRRRRVRVAHCPQSNAHFANGIAPIEGLRQEGLVVGLGTDSAASNNNLDLYEEMMTAGLMAKLHTARAQSLPAWDLLWLATMGSAQALGLSDQIGSLTEGKEADFQAIELCGWSAEPLLDLATQLVYTRNSHRVTDVWVSGQMVVSAGRVLAANVPQLTKQIHRWRDVICANKPQV